MLQGQIRQRPAASERIVRRFCDARRQPSMELALTAGQLAAMKAAEMAVATDERFEHLAPAEDLIQEFAAECQPTVMPTMS